MQGTFVSGAINKSICILKSMHCSMTESPHVLITISELHKVGGFALFGSVGKRFMEMPF